MIYVQEDKDNLFLLPPYAQNTNRYNTYILSGGANGSGGGGGGALLAIPAYLPFAMFSFTQNKGGMPLP